MTNRKPTGVDGGFNLANITTGTPAERKRKQNAVRSQKRRDKLSEDDKTEVRCRVRPKHVAALRQLEKELNEL